MDRIPDDVLGPKMLALRSDQQRRFCWVMANGEKNAGRAARDAGYSDKSAAAKVSAHRLMQDPAILDAIEEAGRKVLRGLAPIAIRSARAILENRNHPQHTRMIETVLDRTGFSAKTEHKVTVEHKFDMTELEDLARRLAIENGIAPERFIGIAGPPSNGTEKTDMGGQVIEGEVVDDGHGNAGLGADPDTRPGKAGQIAGSGDRELFPEAPARTAANPR